MMYHLGEEKKDMSPLFQTILDHIPPPFAKPNEPFHMLVSNIDWSDYVGRIAVGKILGGEAKVGEPVFVIRHSDAKRIRAKITKVFEFTGLGTRETETAVAGNIVGISGFEDVDIGDTLTADEAGHALPFTQIDPPTLEMQFCVNDGPLVGQEGKPEGYYFPPQHNHVDNAFPHTFFGLSPDTRKDPTSAAPSPRWTCCSTPR